MRMQMTLALLATLAGMPDAAAQSLTQGFRIQDVETLTAQGAALIPPPRTIVFADRAKDVPSDPVTGLIRFKDWAQDKPIQKQFLSLYPGYAEPTVNVKAAGAARQHIRRLYMYVAEARFVLDKAPTGIDFSKYTTLSFIEELDTAIKHRPISPGDAMPVKDARFANNKNPDRGWCEGTATAVCIQSHYKLEGKLPMGIALVNQLKEGGKKTLDYLEFQSELRQLSAQDVDTMGLATLTGLPTPASGALEQNIFWINQVLQFGKMLAIFQQHPHAPDKTVVTAFLVLAINDDILEKKKEYEKVPVLRNLVPAQVLAGNSSFNTGNSISAGLPKYARNQVTAIADILQR